MKRMICMVLGLCGLSLSANAGANNILVDCKAKDGLTISGNIPGDLAEFELTIKKAEKSVRLYSNYNFDQKRIDENARLTTVQEITIGVWTVVASGTLIDDENHLELYAIPKTVKVKNIPYGYTANFSAKLSYRLPTLNAVSVDSNLTCKIKYQI